MGRSVTTVLGIAAALAATGPAAADLTTTPAGSKTFVVEPSADGATLCPGGLQLKSVQALTDPDGAAVPVVLLARDRKDLPDGKIVIPYGFRLLRKLETPVRVVMICGY